MARRSLIVVALTTAIVLAGSAVAQACGGLIGPRGSVNLLRTTTLAAYHRGVEHYITAFTYSGQGGGKFGSLVPLPGVPTTVERGGDWTLQRLLREVEPPVFAGAAELRADAAAGGDAKVLIETRIDALDITILEGGAAAVGRWAEKHGFELSPDAPEVLEYYAKRSPIFMAARFNQAEAERRGSQAGDGTPIHLTIPTQTPWVPLRILALGKDPREVVSADVFLLTGRTPSLLPGPDGAAQRGVPSLPGMRLERSEPASPSLLADLASDKGMDWLPRSGMWLTYLRLDAPAATVRSDLAIDPTGSGAPSWVAAGFDRPVGAAVRPIARPIERPILRPIIERGVGATVPDAGGAAPAWLVGGIALGLGLGLTRRRRAVLG